MVIIVDQLGDLCLTDINVLSLKIASFEGLEHKVLTTTAFVFVQVSSHFPFSMGTKICF